MKSQTKQRCREIVKAGWAASLHYTRLDRVIGDRLGVRDEPLVIGYHRVVQDYESAVRRSIAPNLISVDTLESQVNYLSTQYEFVTLDRLASIMQGDSLPEKPVAAITFDDGYRDVYTNAFPLLQRLNIPFAVFVVSDLVGTQQLLPHDELFLLASEVIACGYQNQAYASHVIEPSHIVIDEAPQSLCHRLASSTNAFETTRMILDSMNLAGIKALIQRLQCQVSVKEVARSEFLLLDWQMLSEMVSKGVTIGSHTKSHAILAHESPQSVHDEVSESRRDLERRLQVPVKHFAYPDGSFDRIAMREIDKAGYVSAHTTCNHRDETNPLLTISRRLLWERASMNGFNRFSPAVLACQTNGLFDPAAKCRRDHWV